MSVLRVSLSAVVDSYTPVAAMYLTRQKLYVTVVLQRLLEMFPCSAVAVLLLCLDCFGWMLVLHAKGACVASVGWFRWKSARFCM